MSRTPSASVVVIDVEPGRPLAQLDAVELIVDLTVLDERFDPRRTRASVVVLPADATRLHPGAELAAELSDTGDLLAVVISDEGTHEPSGTVPTLEVISTFAAGRQS